MSSFLRNLGSSPQHRRITIRAFTSSVEGECYSSHVQHRYAREQLMRKEARKKTTRVYCNFYSRCSTSLVLTLVCERFCLFTCVYVYCFVVLTSIY